MEPQVHNEPNHTKSDYLAFSLPTDEFFSKSDSMPKLTYFRVELVRIRPGMGDFLLRVSTPKDGVERNTTITLRGSKELAKFEGAVGTAKVILREMQKRGDKSHNWSETNVEHLAQMLSLPMKTFALNLNLELLRFSTEAVR